jgi:hypothetical protein
MSLKKRPVVGKALSFRRSSVAVTLPLLGEGFEVGPAA